MPDAPRQECRPRAWRGRELGGQRGRPRVSNSSCAPTRAGPMATPWLPGISSPACAGWWTPPRLRSTRRSWTSSGTRRRSSPARQPVESLGVAAADDHTVVISLSSPAPYLPGLMAHPSCAPLHRASHAQLGDRFARAGSQVSNGAFVLQEWLQGSYIRAGRNTHLLEQRRQSHRLGEVPADRRRERRAARLSRRRAALHLRGSARAVRLDQGEPGRGAAPVAAAQHLLLRLQPRPETLHAEDSVERCRWPSIGTGWRTPYCASASCRPGAGCHPACTTTRRRVSITPRHPWPSASQRRSACWPRKDSPPTSR